MAAAPYWKVYDEQGEYRAACKRVEDAVALVAVIGGTVRAGHHRVVWHEGEEAFGASESYDGAAEVIAGRMARGESAPTWPRKAA